MRDALLEHTSCVGIFAVNFRLIAVVSVDDVDLITILCTSIRMYWCLETCKLCGYSARYERLT